MNIFIKILLIFIAMTLVSIDNKLGRIGKMLEQLNKEKAGSNELQGTERKPRRRYHHLENTMV